LKQFTDAVSRKKVPRQSAAADLLIYSHEKFVTEHKDKIAEEEAIFPRHVASGRLNVAAKITEVWVRACWNMARHLGGLTR
jgi:hypothetical protein